MDRLPAEILHEILVLLPLKRKIECMLVCLRWSHIIRSNALLHTICQINSMDKFLHMLKEQPSRGSQVKRLMLFDCCNDDLTQQKIFELLPNMRFIYIKRLLRKKDRDFSREPLQPITLARNRVECIIDLDTTEMAYYALTSGQCSFLTTLQVDFMFTNRSSCHVVQLLKNAPQLLSFKMMNADITLNDLETIHGDLPFLHSLILCDVHITITELPETIIPAPLMKKLLLYLKYVKAESQIQLLHYIRSKYPRLEHFRFWNPTQDIWEHQDRISFSKHGLMPFLQEIGPQLKSLELSSISLEQHFFKHLDLYDCQLQSFYAFTFDRRNILCHLAQSNQCQYLEKLTLQNILPFSFELLQNMSKLRSLELIYSYQDNHQYRKIYSAINFIRLLEMCPDTLESLVIRHANIECYDNITRSYPLKRLVIEGPRLPINIDQVLSMCFPKLESLTLLDCVRIGTSLKLPNINLSYLELLTERLESLITLSVTTWRERQFYVVKRKYFNADEIQVDHGRCHPLNYDAITPAPDKMFEEEVPMVTVECASIRALVINGRLAC
jgi:hypothetical protein